MKKIEAEGFATAVEMIVDKVLFNFSMTMELNDVPPAVAAWAATMAAAAIAASANRSLTTDQAERERGVELLIDAFAEGMRRAIRKPEAPEKGWMH
jgi:hypothetical protein